MGVVLYELCTLQRAFSGNNLMAVMYSIVEGERPHLPADEYTPDLINLFDQMLDKDPRRRPSAVAILQLPFLQQRMEVCLFVCLFVVVVVVIDVCVYITRVSMGRWLLS